jgi:hypothetical protein
MTIDHVFERNTVPDELLEKAVALDGCGHSYDPRRANISLVTEEGEMYLVETEGYLFSGMGRRFIGDELPEDERVSHNHQGNSGWCNLTATDNLNIVRLKSVAFENVEYLIRFQGYYEIARYTLPRFAHR